MGVKNIIGELRVNGVPIGPSVGLAFTSNGDGTCSVKGIGVCTDKKIVIPPLSPAGDNVTGIDDNAFSFCHSIASVNIPDSVTSIGEGAFRDCTGLTNIAIPDSVTSIGASAFLDCDGLIIYCEAQSQPSEWHTDWNSDDCPVVWGHIIDATKAIIAFETRIAALEAQLEGLAATLQQLNEGGVE